MNNVYVLEQLLPIELLRLIQEYNTIPTYPYLHELNNYDIIRYCFLLENKINELEECLWYEPNSTELFNEQQKYINEFKNNMPSNLDRYFLKTAFNPVRRQIIKFRDYEIDGTLINDKRWYMKE
jgi:hypothetical protein